MSGGMASVGLSGRANFKHILINNGMHDSVGGQPTGCLSVDFTAMAMAAGYAEAMTATTKEAAKAALMAHYQDAGRVESWVGKRLREQPDGTWWSDVNPRAQALAKKHVLSSADGSKAWSALAAADLPFEVHLWVAGPDGTVAQWDGADGIDDLAARLPAAKLCPSARSLGPIQVSCAVQTPPMRV